MWHAKAHPIGAILWFSAIVLAMACAGTAGAAEVYRGLTLRAALAELHTQGVAVLFSEALVQSGMQVRFEPEGSTPREILVALLGPHGLSVHDGPDGTFLVVPGRLPAAAAAVRGAIRGVVYRVGTRISIEGAEIRLARGDFLVGSDNTLVHTDSQGRFELTNVMTGDWRLEAAKAGFVGQRLDVRTTPGKVTELKFELLALPTTLDEIEVLPQLEVGSIHGGTSLHRIELDRVPTPRDPWAVVTHSPGVLSDRINVGGSESGAQAFFLAPASSVEENVFSLDGVNTTDMAALGFSAIYYDFDQFEELQVSTGGSDVRTTTAGVAVRMVTKRGTEDLRGSARFLRTAGEGIFGLLPQGSSNVAGQLAPGQLGVVQGNEVDQILDYGVELGGPLVAQHLWVWGSLGINDIELVTFGAFDDDTVLENGAFKLNAQPWPSSSLVVSVNRGHKRKENRGAGPGRAPEATWRQRGPTWVYKLEGSRVKGPALFRVELSQVEGGFDLFTRGGLGPEGGEALLDQDGIWKNGFIGGMSERDSRVGLVETSLYFDTGNLSHTADIGASLRLYHYSDDYRWPGPNQAYQVACENVGTCSDGSGDLVYFERRNKVDSDLDYLAFWAQDTLSAGRWTFSGGLRGDFQDGRNPPGAVGANPGVPENLPAIVYEGADSVFDWASLSPRLAASLRVDEMGKSVLRFSYARFAAQLGVGDVRRINPLETAEALYSFQDLDGDRIWRSGEPLEFIASAGYDPADPTASSNRTDPGLVPETTDEWLLGFERTISRAWIFGLNVTYRRIEDIQEIRPLVRDAGLVRPATADDYVLEQTTEIALPDGQPRTAAFYALKESLVSTGGGLLINGDRSREYRGVTLSFNRRPSDRWMMRGYLNWGEATWNVPDSFLAVTDPTDVAGFGDNDNDLFAAQGRGFRTDLFLQSTWSAQWSGYYRVAPQKRWGFTVAASFLAREGYPIPYMTRFISLVDGIDRQGQLTDGIGEFRADDIKTFDLSLEKELRLGQSSRRKPFKAMFSLSAFNLFNDNYVLQRERNLSSPRANHLEQTLAPRIFRIGLRITRH